MMTWIDSQQLTDEELEVEIKALEPMTPSNSYAWWLSSGGW